ncbi:hypothetical protein F2Q68_00045875 [Brassica cretica]|uniref:Uncharacterized protein n=1 Tax=Brassica cretica TaxID=69181 RepID=A0A8S9LIK2_BRACR|nr:hypothetical protein F2Q68_00045875 [Brassica cretica]
MIESLKESGDPIFRPFFPFALSDLTSSRETSKNNGEGPWMAVPRADKVFPSDARSAGKGKKRKRSDGSGVESSTEETSDVPPSGEWRSDLPAVLPIRAKRLDVFPRGIQKQVTEAKRMGTLPDLSAIIAAQLGLNSGEGSSMAVLRADEVFPSDAKSAGKGKKMKGGDGSGVERSTEETSDVPPSGEPQKKKKKRRTKKKSAGEQLENADEPIEQEEEDAREEELQPEEGASEAEASEVRNDEEGESGDPIFRPFFPFALSDWTSSRETSKNKLPRQRRWVFPSDARSAGKGKKRKRGDGSGVERSTEETSDVPPSGEPRKKNKKKRTKKKSAGEQLEDADERIEQEEEDAREEEIQPEEGGSEAEASEGRNDEEGVSEGEERETSLNAARSGEWRSDLPTVLPIRTKRLDIFPRDIQKQVTEAKRMGSLPDLSAIIAAQLGLTSGEGPSMAVPRADEVFPSDGRSAGKGKKRKRGDGSGVERSTEETSDVPPSGEPQKKKKKRRTKKKSAGEQLENADEPLEQEEEDAREEELQPEEGASEVEASEGRNDEEGVSEGEERETSLNAVCSGDSEEDSEGSPLLIRKRNDEDDDERRSPVLTSPRERTPVPVGGGAVQTVGHPTSPVYPEDFLRSVRAVALLRIYRWSEISVEKIRELKDQIARREWRSDLSTVLPIRAKRLDVFPRDIQKQVTEAKRMGTLPDLSVIIAAQLGLNSGEGSSMAVLRADEVFPSNARSAGKGKKRKRGDGSGVKRSTEETSDVPPSGEP